MSGLESPTMEPDAPNSTAESPRPELKLTLRLREQGEPDDANCHDRVSSWRAAEVLQRFQTSAADFNPDDAIKTPILRDALDALRRITTPGLSVLDVGCGAGLLCRVLRAAGPPLDTWRYAGLEISSELTAYCRRIHPTVTFLHGAAESIPCPDAAFDLVICSGVIQYLPDWRLALGELSRVSRRWLVLLRTPAFKYHPTACCVQEVQSDAGAERHAMTVFHREEFLSVAREMRLTTEVMDYTDEVHRLQGVNERIVHLNFVFRRRDTPRSVSGPAQ